MGVSVATSNVVEVPGDSALRFPRLLFYLGLVFLALLVFRPVASVTISDLFFLASLGATCAYLVARRSSVPYPVSPLILFGIALFALGGLASSFAAQEPTQSVAVILRLVYLTVVWFWLASILLASAKHVRTALVLWVISAGITGAGAIIQLVFGDVIPGTYSQWGRMTGFTANVNDLGGLTAIALVPAIFVAVRPGKTMIGRLGAYALLLSIASGLVLSGSVGGLMAAAVGTVLWFSVTRTAPRTGAVLLAVILLGAAAFMTGRTEDSPSPLERISSVTGRDSKYASFWSRVETYREAAKRIEENPLVGVGLDEKSSVAGQYAVHNLVIGTWYRAGIAGLIGILVVAVAIARTGWMNLAASRSEEEYLMSAALLSSFVAFVIFMFSAPILFTRYGWVSAALLVALRSAQLAGSHATVAVEAARTSRPRLV